MTNGTGTKLRSRLFISIVLLFILFLIIGINPGIDNRRTNRFKTYKYLD
jgi:hypothetical protein